VTALQDYVTQYENIACERRSGVLQVTLHTHGGPWVFNEQAHHDLPLFFADIAADPENKVVILTGAGDRFCTSFDVATFLKILIADPAEGRLRIRSDGVRLLTALADIEVPVIAAINGPALVHAEIPVLADVVLATDTTVLQDAMHFAMGSVPGDGVHVVWTRLLGPNRGRYFLMTGQKLSAREALDLGVVGELLPADRLLERAWELAEKWAKLPRATLVSTRQVINYEWKRLLREQVQAGLTEQGLAAALGVQPSGDPSNIPPLELMPAQS